DRVVAKTDPPLISVPVWLVARLRHAHLFNWLQDLFPEIARHLGVPGGDGLPGRLLQGLRNASLRGAVANVALGSRMAERLAGWGIPSDRVRIIHNWAVEEGIRPLPAADNPLRRLWDLEGRFVVGYSGNMGRAHPFGAVIAAAVGLREHPTIRFLFIGDGNARPGLEAALGTARVVFKDYQPLELLPRSLTLPDVHLITLAPELEGLILPSKLYGILAAGRPVVFVGDADGEIARLVREADCGAVLTVAQGPELAATLRTWAADPRAVARMGANARRLYETRLNRAASLEAWEALLTGPLSPGPGG
ncbi:MAG: glycosyltransferase family 4 protein, partial [Magnetococcales bacterium]|nr:glycosyltransferase family 4 protein [Magnetococcales bacterium]